MPSLLPLIKASDGYIYPSRFDNSEQFKNFILESLKYKFSDIYILPGQPIALRINGLLHAFSHRGLSMTECDSIIKWVSDRAGADTVIKSGEPIDCRYEILDPTYHSDDIQIRFGFRVNISAITYNGTIAAEIVIRPIPIEPLTLEQASLDKEIALKMCPSNGIVLVAGDTGSGKTTTFASIIRFILEDDTPIKGNIITYEEPIEYTYDRIVSKHSIVAQSEIPLNFKTFYAANVAAMRRKPDLILYGELRDSQTITTAIEASMTGHPVFGTVHASDVASVVRRLITRFPDEQRSTAIYDIIENLRFVMSQKLVMSTSDKRIPVRSWLEFTKEIREELVSTGAGSMDNVTSRVRQFVNSHGHSFVAEADRLKSDGLIDDSVYRYLTRL